VGLHLYAYTFTFAHILHTRFHLPTPATPHLPPPAGYLHCLPAIRLGSPHAYPTCHTACHLYYTPTWLPHTLARPTLHPPHLPVCSLVDYDAIAVAPLKGPPRTPACHGSATCHCPHYLTHTFESSPPYPYPGPHTHTLGYALHTCLPSATHTARPCCHLPPFHTAPAHPGPPAFATHYLCHTPACLLPGSTFVHILPRLLCLGYGYLVLSIPLPSYCRFTPSWFGILPSYHTPQITLPLGPWDTLFPRLYIPLHTPAPALFPPRLGLGPHSILLEVPYLPAHILPTPTLPHSHHLPACLLPTAFTTVTPTAHTTHTACTTHHTHPTHHHTHTHALPYTPHTTHASPPMYLVWDLTYHTTGWIPYHLCLWPLLMGLMPSHSGTCPVLHSTLPIHCAFVPHPTHTFYGTPHYTPTYPTPSPHIPSAFLHPTHGVARTPHYTCPHHHTALSWA